MSRTGDLLLVVNGLEGVVPVLQHLGVHGGEGRNPGGIAKHVERKYKITARHDHRVHTEWQRPLSGLKSILMEKLAQASVGGGACPLPFTIFTITYKVAVYVYAPAERADKLTLFHLYPYVLCGQYSVGCSIFYIVIGVQRSVRNA